MNILETDLPGVLIVEPERFGDERGYFMEAYQAERYAEVGISDRFVQDNLSYSRRGVLRGLHFQNPNSQGKLVYVLVGEVFDVAVDIRVGSPTYGQWTGVVLSAENGRQIWVPQGFAHGFCILSETALVTYKCTGYYDRTAEAAIRWDDPVIGIAWPVTDPVLSPKDAKAPSLATIDRDRLPRWEGRR
jgi:dTDP-4-dehydrorhamnose 3,5-epimerase